jgi:hypothetical protein
VGADAVINSAEENVADAGSCELHWRKRVDFPPGRWATAIYFDSGGATKR